MEEENELLKKAIEQSLASILLEFDDDFCIEKNNDDYNKKLVLRGNENGRMGRLYYR